MCPEYLTYFLSIYGASGAEGYRRISRISFRGECFMLYVHDSIRKKTGLRPMRQTPQDAWDAQDRNLQSGHTRSDAIVGDTSTNEC